MVDEGEPAYAFVSAASTAKASESSLSTFLVRAIVNKARVSSVRLVTEPSAYLAHPLITWKKLGYCVTAAKVHANVTCLFLPRA